MKNKLALFIAAAQANDIALGKKIDSGLYMWKRQKHVWGIEKADLFGISISERPRKMFNLPQGVCYSSMLTIDCVAEFTFYQDAEDAISHLKEILSEGIWETVNGSR